MISFSIFHNFVASQIVGSIESCKPYIYSILWFIGFQERMNLFNSIVGLIMLLSVIVALKEVVI